MVTLSRTNSKPFAYTYAKVSDTIGHCTTDWNTWSSMEERIMPTSEIVTGRSIIVINRTAGDRITGGEVGAELQRRWPHGTMEQIDFQDLRDDPERIAGADVVFGAGGDGTICTVAGHCMDHSVPLFIPLDTGTNGVIPKVLGFGRKTGEKAIPYTQKILTAIENNEMRALSIPAGVVRGHKTADSELIRIAQENFLMSTGVGIMATLLRSAENERYTSQKKPRIHSLIIPHYRKAMSNAPVFSFQHGDETYDCVDANVIKSPFQRYFNPRSRVTGEDRFIGLMPPVEGKSRKRILMDLALLAVGMRPKFGAIIYKRLAPGESIQIDQPPTAQHIDSEDKGSYDTIEIIPSDINLGHVYHIAQCTQPSKSIFTLMKKGI